MGLGKEFPEVWETQGGVANESVDQVALARTAICFEKRLLVGRQWSLVGHDRNLLRRVGIACSPVLQAMHPTQGVAPWCS